MLGGHFLPLVMIFVIGASISFFLVFILISKKGKSLADRILLTWMIVLGAHLLVHIAEINGLDLKYPMLLGWGTPFPLLHGPLMYLYAKSLTSNNSRLSFPDYLHFLPVVIIIVWMLPFIFSPAQEKVQYVEGFTEEVPLWLIITLFSYMVSGITYVVLSLLVLRKHRKNLLGIFSYTDQINLNWLRNLIYGMIIIWAIVIIGHTLDNAFGLNIKEEVDNLIFLGISLFVLMIGFFGIKQTRIFSGESPLGTPVKEGNVTRYQKSGLKNDQADELQIRLEKIMEEEKPFLDHKLSLKTLAGKLDIHPNYLSQLINERFHKNFYDFINTARTKEFKSLIQQPASQNITLLALAFECGFSSKSAFNKFFKKSTGLTPSQFQRSIK